MSPQRALVGPRLLVAALLSGALALAACSKGAPQGGGAAGKDHLKAGFVYVGPVGDYGWSNAHDKGRLFAQQKFPWLETMIVESVPEADAPRIIDRLVNEAKCDIVFTTSFGYMDATVAAGRKYPGTKFMHCSGFKREPNVGTYFADMYQMYYLNGLMAGALTKSGKVGYVGAQPIPEVVRHIDAFALGVRELNPKAKVHVKWLYSWYDPAKAKEAAEALISEGCDALAFTEDSPAVIQAAEERTRKGQPVYAFSHYSPMQKFGPDSVVSGQLTDWGVLYEGILRRVHDGTWTNEDVLALAREKAVLLGGEVGQPINPKYVDVLKKLPARDKALGRTNVYDLVMKRLDQVSQAPAAFEPFTGPIRDQAGKVRVADGAREPIESLMKIDWFVDNVVGELPKSK